MIESNIITSQAVIVRTVSGIQGWSEMRYSCSNAAQENSTDDWKGEKHGEWCS